MHTYLHPNSLEGCNNHHHTLLCMNRVSGPLATKPSPQSHLRNNHKDKGMGSTSAHQWKTRKGKCITEDRNKKKT